VIEEEYADDNGEYFPGGRDKRKDVLLEVGNDVVYADLPNYLKHTYPYNVPEGIWVVDHEFDTVYEGTFKDREGRADIEGV